LAERESLAGTGGVGGVGSLTGAAVGADEPLSPLLAADWRLLMALLACSRNVGMEVPSSCIPR